ncbi:hypothetical protein CLOM_g7447 [Closterium sp. NIES-68]|nr:hypothetical protein CLOM_g7447 [Closterium sp. NIES-68]GJP81023.1 hypothetical protein CLOP_g11206 [Closterium sp. NIES-67]
MNRIFGVKKDKKPAPSLTEATERINARGESLDDKIRKLEAELVRYRDQIKRTRPGPAQEALKARAMRVLKQKKMLEGQRDNLYNQSFNMEQVAFAQEGIKDAQATVAAMKAANKELKTQMKSVKIEDIDSMQDDMFDLMDYSNEIQDALGQSYGVPEDIDEDELLGELDALEADMGTETASDSVPSYLLPDAEPDVAEADADLFLPSAPTANAASAAPVAESARPLRT